MYRKICLFSIFLFIVRSFAVPVEAVENDCISPLVQDERFELLITQDEIREKIKDIATVINSEYEGRELVVIIILKGAICFASDLIRELQEPLIIEAIQCKSYGMKGARRGKLTIEGIERLNLKNKDVLVVDDIYDSGNTLTQVNRALREKGVASLKTLVLINKKGKKIKDAIYPDWSLFEVEDRFVVGYGLDYKENYRGLKGIFAWRR